MTDELPPGWAIARLQSLVGHDGLMSDGDWVESKDQDPNGEVRLIQLADVGDGNFLDKSNRFLTQQKAEKLNCTFLAPRDILISRLGEPLGKTCLFPPLDQPCVTVVDVHVVRPVSEQINREWLMHSINSATVRRVIDSMSSGTTRKRVTGQKLKDLEVRVPPAPEQERIASKIDELFSRIEEGEHALERVQKLVERYRQSVLKAAVTGELTRGWREKNKGQLESGEALLARTLKARREAWEKAELDKMKAKGIEPANDKWKQKYEEPSLPDLTDLPDLPAGWIWASLDQFAAPVERAIQSGPFGSNLLHSEFQSTGKLVVGIDNVRDGWFSPGAQNRISEEKFAELAKYAARPKDFLVTVMATIGRTCVVPEDIEPSIITKHVYRFTLDQALVLPEFVNLCVMGSPAVRSQMFGKVQGQTRPGLNKSILIRFAFPLPSIAEQRQILDHCAELLSQIEPFRPGLQSQTRLSGSLRQAVLGSAFRGDLVPHDPHDEPASALLERISATPTKPSRGLKNKSKEPV